MNSSFLSRNNINNVYQQLQQGILKHSQFDLNSDPTYRKIVKNMLHMVHKHHNVDTSTLQSLNTLAFQKITPYMLQIVSQGGILGKQKTKTTNNETKNENNQNITSIDESVFSEIKDENTKMLEENVHIAQQKTEEEIFKNAYASNTNDILHTIEENTQNLIDPANTGALDSSYVMPGVEVSASGHNYETINVEFNDPSISNLTPKALNVVNTKKEKEEFTNQEDFQESRKKQELDETQENFSFQISKQNELKKQTELLKNLKNVFSIETFQNQEIVEKTRLNEATNRDSDKSRKKTLVLDTGSGFEPLCKNNKKDVYWADVDYVLKEPMFFGGPTDVYLESLTINNPAIANDINNLYFSIGLSFIGQDVTYSNNEIFKDRFVIPNENISASGDNKVMKYHLKSNYIGVCQQTKLDNINVTFKNENGSEMESSTNLIDSGYTEAIVTFAAAYNIGETGAMNTSAYSGNTLNTGEFIFNKNGEKLGAVSLVGGNQIQLASPGLLKDVASGDEIYYAPGKRVKYNLTSLSAVSHYIGAASDSDFALQNADSSLDLGLEIQLDGGTFLNETEINREFPIGTEIYNYIGELVGTVYGIKNPDNSEKVGLDSGSGNFQLFFKEGLLISLGSSTSIYTSPPSAVFNNNSKNNRIIMELVFRERDAELIS